jgi:hypothetical protein
VPALAHAGALARVRVGDQLPGPHLQPAPAGAVTAVAPRVRATRAPSTLTTTAPRAARRRAPWSAARSSSPSSSTTTQPGTSGGSGPPGRHRTTSVGSSGVPTGESTRWSTCGAPGPSGSSGSTTRSKRSGPKRAATWDVATIGASVDPRSWATVSGSSQGTSPSSSTRSGRRASTCVRQLEASRRSPGAVASVRGVSLRCATRRCGSRRCRPAGGPGSSRARGARQASEPPQVLEAAVPGPSRRGRSGGRRGARGCSAPWSATRGWPRPDR